MKIALNATCFNNRPSGANQRFQGIYSEVFKQAPQHEFYVYMAADADLSQGFKPLSNLHFVRTPIKTDGRLRKAISGALYWHTTLRGLRPDIVESFHLPAVVYRGATSVLTIHDIGPLRENRGATQRLIYEATLKRSIAKVDRVITVSEFMRRELLELFPRKQISVVHNGIDANPFAAIDKQEADRVLRAAGLPGNYLLAVGHFRKRKNYARLIGAMAILEKQGIEEHLVLVGNDSGDLAAIQAQIDELGLAGRVHIKTGLADHEVRCVFKLCRLFVFPSSYEGFGIPILEAMAAGRPMAISDIPVFQEITEGRVAYFDPDSSSDIAETIARLLDAPEEASWQVEYGKARVRDFSFSELGSQIAKIHDGLA